MTDVSDITDGISTARNQLAAMDRATMALMILGANLLTFTLSAIAAGLMAVAVGSFILFGVSMSLAGAAAGNLVALAVITLSADSDTIQPSSDIEFVDVEEHPQYVPAVDD